MERKVSFITVDYNGLEQTIDLIRSLFRTVRSVDWEIIVVDNASANDEAEALRELFPSPRVKALRSPANLGFAGGNNFGLEHASGDYLFFINNDTEIMEDGLPALCAALDSNPSAGIVCPKICFFDPKDTIQYAGYTDMEGFRMKNGMIGYGCKDDGSFDKAGETAFPHGAAMMVRRAALEDVGPMPEMYFLYYEELDWAMSFRRKGWKILFEPACVVYHKDSMTTVRGGVTFNYYMIRSRLIYAWRNLSGMQRRMSIIHTRWAASTKRILAALLHGRFDVAWAIVRANVDFLKMRKDL